MTAFGLTKAKFANSLFGGVWIVLLASSASAQQPVRFDAGSISGLPARNIGSAAMSGRISAVAAHRENGRLTVFAGAASGGVWKSVNGGTTFNPVFDNSDVQSVGAIGIDPTNPKTPALPIAIPALRHCRRVFAIGGASSSAQMQLSTSFSLSKCTR